MTEEEAKAWLQTELGVSRETLDRLGAFRELVIEESAKQNLISAASIDHFWARHIVDSAQLLRHATAGPWLDLGTGAGFPGIVVAMMRDIPVTFVESRRRRVEFLCDAVNRLALTNVAIQATKLEAMASTPYATISARAFAPLPKLLKLAHRFSENGTIWVLPKGKSAQEELESIRASWQGSFHVKQSVTDPESAIIVAHGVKHIKQAKTRR